MIEHECSKCSNQTLNWLGSDSKERWRNHILDKDKNEFLIHHGWDSATSIEYRFNSHGFRCAEWDNIQTHNFALGCSHTQGVGLPLKHTWPAQLSKLIKESVLNLGVGGGSLDTCFRILDHYLKHLKVKNIYLLRPEKYRFDFYQDSWYTLTVNHGKEAFKHWASYDENVELSWRKTNLAIERLCDSHNVNLKVLDCTNQKTFKDDWARDFAHNGPKWNKSVAQAFADL